MSETVNYTMNSRVTYSSLNSSFCNFKLQEACAYFQQFTPEKFKEFCDCTSTFRYGYITQGDLLWIPSGHIMVEKAVVAHNLILRVPSTLLCLASLPGTLLIGGSYPSTLGLTSFVMLITKSTSTQHLI